VSSLIESSEARNTVLWSIEKLRDGWTTLPPDGKGDRIKYLVQAIASLDEPADRRECLTQLKAITGYPLQTLEQQLEQEKKFATSPEPQESEEQRVSLATKLVRLVENSGLTLFHDQFGEPHAALLKEGTHVFKLNSKAFRRWLARLGWARLKNAVPREAIQSAIETLSGKAQFDGKQIELHVRTAWHEGTLFYDLGNGQAVRITGKGWEIVNDPPILFRRYPHQKPQVIPVPGGNVRDLLRFANLPKHETGRLLLLLVSVVTDLIPGFPHPLKAIHGQQGAAKSTLLKVIKELVDPSFTKVVDPGDNLREFVLKASSHWFLSLDNLSFIPPWLSDALCRVCTGEGFSKRELFTDTDEVVIALMRAVGINGINLVVDRPDLLDRCLILELESITEERRIPEEEFWADFEKGKPALLGALFDVVAGAIRQFPDVKLSRLPRMADFTKWGVAVTLALGEKPAEFLEAYRLVITQQHEEAIASSPVALAVLALMKERPEWIGTPSSLLGDLNDLAEDLQIDTRGKSWPKEPNWVWRRLMESKTNLEAMGLKIDRKRVPDRLITIQRVRENGVNADNAVNAEADPAPPLTPLTPLTPESPSCTWCGSRHLWRSENGVTRCGVCHPPAGPERVVWLDEWENGQPAS